jgi:DNA-nicking Smr family endonuclease
MEVYTHLVDLVSGDAPFELSYSDEYVDGAVIGLSPKILKKLRRGELSYQDHVDLHGCTREEARDLVTSFLKESFARKHRCVLVVSGRGLRSKDKQPVLKQSLVQWLIRAPLKRLVLAFASARSYDGGAGAFYVLLRRNEKKDPPLVTPAC